MLATEALKQDHRVIERMLAILNAAAARAEKGQELPPDFFPRVLDFIRNFADRCHHAKEEDNLFPALVKRGIPKEGGPVGVMLMEHDQGRAFVRGMDEASQLLVRGDRAALKAATQNALGYADLLSQHIDKEDNILYMMADRVLSAAEHQELVKKFEQLEAERIGPGKHPQYVELVEALEREMGIK